MKNRAFTLIEVMVALLIFSILAGMTGGIIYQMLTTRNATQALAERLAQRQVALNIIEQDLEQILPGSVLHRDNQLIMQRLGFPNPQARFERSEIQMVRYTVEQQELRRYARSREQTKQPMQTLFNNVSDFSVELYPAKQPVIVKLTITFINDGILQRSIHLPSVANT